MKDNTRRYDKVKVEEQVEDTDVDRRVDVDGASIMTTSTMWTS
jgi:hypothetical protein